jgi:hypothetical protein
MINSIIYYNGAPSGSWHRERYQCPSLY